MEIHQIVPYLGYGDAVGNHALHIREVLCRWGYESYIYSEGCHPKVKEAFRNLKEHRNCSSYENILIYHHCIGGTQAYQYFSSAADIKILIYHNITPAHLIREYNKRLSYQAERGRRELAALKDLVHRAFGVSDYNCREMRDAGFQNTDVLPIPIYLHKFDSQKPNENVLKFYDDDCRNIIFVGRISPNKRQEDLIRIFNYYSRNIDAESRLFLVGSYSGMERYCNYLLQIMRDFNVRNVVLTGHTSFDELVAYYQLGDVFLSMSEHEGFCVPLLESMYFDIPVIAFNSSAIPDTLGNAGILINEKREDRVAELIDLVSRDSQLRNQVIQEQRERLQYFENDRTEEILKKCLHGVMH